ncbi:phage tail assembly chaperone [Acidovorax sp. LjRoot74]|uniref:phage tail assembly chaperone n=1 Tax=Acidovorax sp. LjRoot74 TaxID=3342337 RepID=UPI003ED07BD4
MTNKAPKVVQPVKLKSLKGGQASEFPLTIPVQRLDGVVMELSITFHAFGKKAWTTIKDEFHEKLRADAAARAAALVAPAGDAQAVDAAPAEPEPIKLAPRVSKGIENDASLVLQIAKGWDLEDEFNAENLQDLEDRFGGALTAIVNAYDKAIYQGQLGN